MNTTRPNAPRGRTWGRTSLAVMLGLVIAVGAPATTYSGPPTGASHSPESSSPESSSYWARSAALMYYTGKSGDSKQIGVARSRDGINWLKFPANPVLRPGKPGQWDDVAVTDPSIIRQRRGTALYLYYAGEGASTGVEEIGLAVSYDGVRFFKHPANPVIKLGPPGSFDALEVSNPMVVFAGGQYRGYYAAKGFDAAGEEVETTGLAVSDDGVHWTKLGRTIDVGLPGTFDEFEVSDPGITRAALRGRKGTFHGDLMWLDYFTAASGDTSVDPEGRRSIGLAFSVDGRNWFKVSRPILEHGPDGAFDALRVGNAALAMIDHSLFLYYGGRTRVDDIHGEDVGAIGLATSNDGFMLQKFAAPVLAPSEPWEGTLTANATVVVTGE